MATIKSYTDINQSRKLAEILPIESADMKWFFWREEIDAPKPPTFGYSKTAAESYKDTEAIYLPCWSLASLLSVLPDEITDADDVYRNMFFHLKGKYIIQYPRLTTLWPSLLSVEADNPVDVCVEMIIKLNELKLL